MKRIVILSLAAVVAVATGCSKSTKNPGANGGGGDAASAPLIIKWPAGQKYQMHVDLLSDTEVTLPQQKQPMKQSVNLGEDYSLAVMKELENGGRQLELKFQNLSVDMEMNGNKMMSFDSKQNPSQDSTNNPLSSVFRKMADAPVHFVTDSTGHIEKVENTDELKKHMGNSRNPIEWAVYKQMFGEDILKQYGSFADAFPGKPVSPGDSWKVTRKIAGPTGIIKVDVKYTLKNWEQHNDRRCAHLENTGDMSSQKVDGGPNLEIQDGKFFGDTWLDPELGMVVDAVSHQTMTVKASAGKETITPKISQTIRFALVDTQAAAK